MVEKLKECPYGCQGLCYKTRWSKAETWPLDNLAIQKCPFGWEPKHYDMPWDIYYSEESDYN